MIGRRTSTLTNDLLAHIPREKTILIPRECLMCDQRNSSGRKLWNAETCKKNTNNLKITYKATWQLPYIGIVLDFGFLTYFGPSRKLTVISAGTFGSRKNSIDCWCELFLHLVYHKAITSAWSMSWDVSQLRASRCAGKCKWSTKYFEMNRDANS